MAINTQSRLEEEAIIKRKELLLHLNYDKENEYSDNHPDALATGDPQGKGVGSANSSYSYLLPDRKGSKTSYRNTITTNVEAGGQYDIEGVKGLNGAFQGNSGRNFLMTINLYSNVEEYGPDSVDTTQNVLDGQYQVK